MKVVVPNRFELTLIRAVDIKGACYYEILPEKETNTIDSNRTIACPRNIHNCHPFASLSKDTLRLCVSQNKRSITRLNTIKRITNT